MGRREQDGSMEWRIGTSGWNYRHWREVFYPRGVPQARWLEYYAGHFDTVEVNATFYRLPPHRTFENWYEKTPDTFLWSVKGSKYITHTRRLVEPPEPLERLYNGVECLRQKLGPILFQLPPSLSFDRSLFESFCRHLRPSFQHALEVRNATWLVEEAFRVMEQFNIAFCISDTAGRYPYHEAVTADFLYVRLHGSKKLYASCYSEEELGDWAKKIRGWGKRAFVYFDNDFEGFAVKNAARLKELLGL
ncbi:MAG: DUF72 domain-containing protein [Deltaproteobacteria bacterium]|nr:DUF72 domain-containing protein [Deltaproteobacteria bacterium]MBW2136985.1 DUF72 domain-containing protein [Deltaproteobacteria bacterium]